MNDVAGREIKYGDEVAISCRQRSSAWTKIAKVIGLYDGRIALVELKPDNKQPITHAKPWWFQGHSQMILITQREI
jgi:hypothetical protein